MSEVLSVNPFRCRMWSLHDRMFEHISVGSCKAEIESFTSHGQLLPVMARRLQNNPAYDYELIFGARRLFVAQHLNKPIQVEVRSMADREAIVAMDMENRQRSEMSAYERGLGFALWIQEGHFKTQEEIAKALRISASRVSKLLKLAKLPPVVVGAFESPLQICEGWGLEIAAALENPDTRAPTVSAARAICAITPRPPAMEVYRRLVSAAARGRKPQHRTHDEVVRDDDGNPLFRIRHQLGAIAVLLPRRRISAKALAEIRAFISDALRGGTSEPQDSQRKTAAKLARNRISGASVPLV